MIKLLYVLLFFSGNNIYGDDIRTLLTELGTSNKREEYILMDRIRPPVIPGLILWQESDLKVAKQPVINELGILGAYVRSVKYKNVSK